MSLKNGRLTVVANNSDLVEVLRRVASLGGMRISGLGKSTRIFGVYGPGPAQKVLTKLLTGSGYSFMMVGKTSEGTPRKLLLVTSREVESAHTSKSAGEHPPEIQPAPKKPELPPTHFGPGAIHHVPPSEAPGHADRETRVRRNLQRLQQMRQKIEQQQQQQGKPQK